MFKILATYIYHSLLKTHSRIKFKSLVKLRNILLKFVDPTITLSFRNYKLTLPFSHTIFLNQKLYPSYDMHLHKIAHYIYTKMGYIHIVDIGANIGDTAVFMDMPQAHFLLIEGECHYNTLIKRNFYRHYNNLAGGGNTNLIIENSFIADKQESYSITRYDGSAKLQTSQDSHNTNLMLNTLDSIITKHQFTPNFIKIDTDGFDFKVLRSAQNTLKAHKSAIIFEWDLFFLQSQNEDPLSIFPYLYTLGYEHLIIFDNFGNLLLTLSSQDTQNLTLLLEYTKRSNKHIYYYDVLTFHKDTPLDEIECIANL